MASCAKCITIHACEVTSFQTDADELEPVQDATDNDQNCDSMTSHSIDIRDE